MNMCASDLKSFLSGSSETTAAKRTRLWELDAHLHCAVIGTCLSATELRKLGQKCRAPYGDGAQGDYKLHSYMVGLARHSHGAGKVLHKYLERKYARNIKAFSLASSPIELKTVWEGAKAQGDIAGPFWAVLTHELATSELIADIYGEVHMLSHLAGASNRADHRELATLKSSLDQMQAEMDELRKSHRRSLDKRDHLIGELKTELNDANVKARKCDELEALLLSERDGESIARLERRIDCLMSRVIQETDRADMTQNRLVEMEALKNEMALGLQHKDQRIFELENVSLPAEKSQVPCLQSDGCAGKGDLCGRCIAYVGGQTKQAAFFRAQVERRNGQFIHHDGGLHDGQARLTSILNQADAVLFPVTCVSHEATREIKRICMKHKKPFVPLRSQGMSAFTRGLDGLEEDGFASTFLSQQPA
jgi:hypothetical protein